MKKSRRGLNLRRKYFGAVLIELAFAIPLFLALIYYTHDLPKQKLMQRRMQFTAYLTAAILQNLAAQRISAGETVKKNDFLQTARLAYLSTFPGNTMIGGNSGNPLGYYPYTAAVCIKGTDLNKAQGKWIAKSEGKNGGSTCIDKNSGSVCSLGFSENETDAGSIAPSLYIDKDECKLAVQCLLCYDAHNAWGDKFSAGPHKGKLCRDVPPRTAFNFLFFTPAGAGEKKSGFFPATAIFSAGPGFTEDIPAD